MNLTVVLCYSSECIMGNVGCSVSRNYTVELLSHDKNQVVFKASSPVGSLAADTVVLRPKSAEEKVRRAYAPQVRGGGTSISPSSHWLTTLRPRSRPCAC